MSNLIINDFIRNVKKKEDIYQGFYLQDQTYMKKYRSDIIKKSKDIKNLILNIHYKILESRNNINKKSTKNLPNYIRDIEELSELNQYINILLKRE